MCAKVERELERRHEYMSACVCMSDPEEETKRGYLALHFCLIARKQCLSLNKLTLSLDGGTAPGISLSLHLSSNKVGHVNICIYALHFTRELESSCLCCAISPTLKQPFRDGT